MGRHAVGDQHPQQPGRHAEHNVTADAQILGPVLLWLGVCLHGRREGSLAGSGSTHFVFEF